MRGIIFNGLCIKKETEGEIESKMVGSQQEQSEGKMLWECPGLTPSDH